MLVLFLFLLSALALCAVIMPMTAHSAVTASMATATHQYYQQKSPNNNPDTIAFQELNHYIPPPRIICPIPLWGIYILNLNLNNRLVKSFFVV